MTSHNAALHEDWGMTLWIVNSVFIALATMAVIARFYARKLRKLSLGVDDWAILFALLLDWALYGLFVGCRNYGLGRHRGIISDADVLRMLKLLYYFQIFYILAPPTVKLSLLFLYKRIFVSSRFLIIVYIVGAIISIWAIIMVFLGIFNCKPISAFWTGEGKCIPLREFAIGYAVVNIATDVAVWLMPIPNMWRLQLPLAQKVALTFIFALGIFDFIAAIIRLIASMLVLGNWDVTYDYARGFMWSIIEVSVGIICTCLPTMRIILRSAFNGKLGRMLGFSSLTPHRQSTGRRPWIRSMNYDEIQGPWMIRDGGCHQHNSDVTATSGTMTRTVSSEREAGESGIRVLEEVKVELQDIKPVVGTARNRFY
ncbi:hypothetical protein P170DRAFT_446068 [Aspergillus steynii IBT 23096]|uniref:Rhodopsin domain-containing protein n=1 Tax=Aspergillus steynii IBT 23096 TaxID=1392250 RepID=A0A2I2GD97_9EURO|nr:uncharacterized protein P170DRAFT_446068 [Aspergillus steynii IBT 23096]PLB50855.1 hypothetical protein P170DRAFT_446068 [Aspergillus steynii IBT 23096]